jgi:hypothetical protein
VTEGMDAKTANQLRNLGFNPDKLPPGTKINGKPIAEATAPAEKKPKGPNKTEAAWARHLDFLKASGVVKDYWYEPFALRLTDPDPQTRRRMTYWPDYMVLLADEFMRVDHRPWIVEVKGGHIWEDSKVKFRLAEEKYRQVFRFAMIQKNSDDWNTILGETWIDHPSRHEGITAT